MMVKEHLFEIGRKLFLTKDDCWFIEFDVKFHIT